MITEDYVSFETAKLLKEKGFDEDIDLWYDENGEMLFQRKYDINRDWRVRANLEVYECPTLQMAMKWLREVQALNIYARGVWKDVEVQYGDWEPAVVGYEWFVESLIDDTYSKTSIEPFLTYEEACEAAIKYCLENLI